MLCRRVVAALLAHGQIRRGYIGVATIPVRLPSQVERQAGRSSALLVTAVEEDSPASRAGLELGDVLLSAGGLAVSHAGDLLPLVEEERIGEAVPARIWRGGSVRAVLLAIGARGSAKGAPQP